MSKMIEALEKSFLLRFLADRVYFWSSYEEFFEDKQREVVNAIVGELNNTACELIEMPGVDFAANWRTDRGKFENWKEYLITVNYENETFLLLAKYDNFGGVGHFDADDNWTFREDEILAWMPAPEPYRKEK